MSPSEQILLVDSHAYLPPAEFKVNQAEVVDIWKTKEKKYSDEELDFMQRVYVKSGLGQEETYLPPAIHPKFCQGDYKTGINEAMDEARMCLCGALEGLMAKTGITPKDIDILVTTCSIFCPTPSMSSMIVNHFKLREDVQAYHLGGMGCANGVISVNMVADLLKAHPGTNAVLLTTETTTPAYYPGTDRHRLVPNLLFRMGGAAVLFSNKASAWRGRAKYALKANHRVHVGQVDEAYEAIRYSPDEEGIKGIYLGKNVVTEASRALTKAMWKAGPSVLNWKQKAAYVADVVKRKAGYKAGEPFKPSFSGPVQHFLLHAGGAKVLDGLGKALQLTERDLEPSRAVLHDYGNVSSSTTWYTLGYVESVRGVKRGDKVLQVGVGSGIKCGVNVWQAVRDVRDVHEAWAHRAAPADVEASAARRVLPFVDVSHGAMHAALRVLFLAMMALLVGLFHAYMLMHAWYPAGAFGPGSHTVGSKVFGNVSSSMPSVLEQGGAHASSADSGVISSLSPSTVLAQIMQVARAAGQLVFGGASEAIVEEL